MDNSTKQNILNELKKIAPSLVVDTIRWPEPYCRDKTRIRAIVLGCDPSNQYDRNLKYAFAMETEIPRLKQLFAGPEKNLSEIPLFQNDLYAQNLCQNYFTVGTAANTKWQSAAKLWIPYLKKELDMLPIGKRVPVFLTAGDLYKVLIKEEAIKHDFKELYDNPELSPIAGADNYLDRPLFPLYRGGFGFYDLKNWPSYVNRLKEYFQNQ